MSTEKYYLYRHIRLDTNQPFYIGIGTKFEFYSKSNKKYYSRAFATSKRGNIWNKIVNKTLYEVEIMLESDDYQFIKQKEIEFIKLYGRKNLGTGCLSNLTNGGEGTLGSKPKIKMKNPIFCYSFGGLLINKFEYINDISIFLNKNKTCINNIRNSIKENGQNTAYNYIWTLNDFIYKICNDKSKCKKRFGRYNKEGILEKEYLGLSSLEEKFNKSAISQCLNSKIKSSGGFLWKFIIME